MLENLKHFALLLGIPAARLGWEGILPGCSGRSQSKHARPPTPSSSWPAAEAPDATWHAAPRCPNRAARPPDPTCKAPTQLICIVWYFNDLSMTAPARRCLSAAHQLPKTSASPCKKEVVIPLLVVRNLGCKTSSYLPRARIQTQIHQTPEPFLFTFRPHCLPVRE